MWRVLVVLIAIGACEKPVDKPTSPTVGGHVVEVSGKVVANGRVLARSGEVFADEVVETAPDASVVIELSHNKVRWSLGGGQRARVDESVAWKLERQESNDTPVDHATSAAGRHAERTAADTKETVTNSPVVVGGGNTSVEQPKAPVLKPPSVQQPVPKPEKNPDQYPKSGGKVGRGDCDEVTCAIDPTAACCKKTSPRHKPADSGGRAGDLPDGLTKDNVQKGMKAVKEKVLACGETSSAKGVVKLVVKVAPDGSVVSVVVKETPDQALGECAAAAVRTARFDPTRDGGSFTYPFVF